MVAVNSNMVPLGSAAPDFCLPDPEGRRWSLDELTGTQALVVMFICNHCPYVIYLADHLADTARMLHGEGASFVAINSNDAESYPEDNPESMLAEINTRGYDFPYLIDADQSVAKAYRAACTPDFFVYDADSRLAYRGQYCDARPGNDVELTGSDLIGAVRNVLAGQPVPEPQHPSMGCNIKWRPGGEPDWF